MTHTSSLALASVTIIGPGRLGRAIAGSLARSGIPVRGPLHRGEWESTVAQDDVVLLCVPDAEIARVAQRVTADAILGHCAGALTLDALGQHRAFSLHPLLAVTGEGTRFEGAAAAIDGTSDETLAIARALAERLGMTAITVAEQHRVLYHASAVMASNYLVALEETAALLGQRVGLERRHLAKLAESALTNWARDGAASLTGPVARGDNAIVERQREEVGHVYPALLPLWDALTDRTRAIAANLER